MKENLKKYWFVVLVGVLLVAGIGYFAWDQTSSILPGKKVDGKDVVYSLKGYDVTADQFYDDMIDQLGTAGIFQFIQSTVVDATVETTAEIEDEASIQADTVKAQFQASYGAEYEEILLQAIRAVGHDSIDDLQDYFVEAIKYEMFAKQILDGTYDASVKPRILSHILIKCADPENPTEEEKAKMDAVDAALAEGTDFGEVALNHSEDSSASNYGSLGYADVNTSFVTEFLDASMKLAEGETSDWVKTQFGYHLIKCDAAELETLKTYDEFYDGLSASNPTLVAEGIWNKAKELGITFTDETMEEKIMTYLGINGGNE